MVASPDAVDKPLFARGLDFPNARSIVYHIERMCESFPDYARLRCPRPRSQWPRRGRRAAAAVGALGLLLLGLAHAVQGSASGAYEIVTVGPGDTLWGIATQRYPRSDVREKVDEIERANGLHGPAIAPGQRLRVPST